jgi:toxin ParE1/3/4
VRRVRFLTSAQRDLVGLRLYLTRASGSLRIGQGFTERLRQRCHEFGGLSTDVGREREDLGPGLRSFTWRDYLILFRYVDGTTQIVRILHGRRDIPAVMANEPES